MEKGRTMKVAVIGGSGFIGSVLVSRLRGKADVRIVDIATPPQTSRDLEFVRADVTLPDEIRSALQGCDLIVNLAAVHSDDVRPLSRYDEVNVDGAKNVCDAASALGVNRILFTSSVAIYGFPQGAPDETVPANPFNAYGRTKKAAEVVYESWAADQPDERRLVIVRPTVVFGPGNRGNVYNLMKQVTRKNFVLVGDGTNRKSMAYVENVAAFLEHLVFMPATAGTAVYNYVDKPDFSMNDLISKLRGALGLNPSPMVRLPYSVGLAIGSAFDIAAHLAGKTFPISRIRVQKFCLNTTFTAELLKETGFSPPVSLDDALGRVAVHEFGAAD